MRAGLRIAFMTMVAALVLSGCETTKTASIDTTKTAAIADTAARHLGEGRKQFAGQNYGLAESHFRQAVEAEPLNGAAWLGLAASYDQLGRFDLSDRAYEQLLKIEGPKPAILNNQGYSHILRGDKKKARKLLNQARAAMPANTTVQENLKLLRRI